MNGTKVIRKLISKTEMSKRAGVGKAAVSQALKRGLGEALYADRIDSNHPEAIKFIERNLKRQNIMPKIDAQDLPQRESLVEKYLEWSLKEIIDVFGTDVEFLDWLKAVKSMEDVKEKRIKNAVAQGELITREFVSTHVISIIEAAFSRLLNDSPRTLTARVLEAKEAGQSREKIEKLVCDLLSVQLKGLKTRAKRALKC
jgi:hypothetical protein